MEHIQKSIAIGTTFLVVGLVVGWGIWGGSHGDMSQHQMSDGSMMSNSAVMEGHSMTMRQMMDSMSAGLVGKKGNDFDSAFLEEMIPHHQGAVAMAQMVLATSKRPELIKLANDIITSQQKEIDQMRSWQRTWFGVQPL
jgi:uncharacterized protein (DUF305 family)